MGQIHSCEGGQQFVASGVGSRLSSGISWVLGWCVGPKQAQSQEPHIPELPCEVPLSGDCTFPSGKGGVPLRFMACQSSSLN